jgi:peptide/nickel transport system permease protein
MARTPVVTLPFRHDGSRIILVVLVMALFAPWLAPYDPTLQETANRLMPPSPQHWLGTDAFGRDILSRLIYGARPTLLLVLFVVLLMAPVGIAIGILAGYFGGLVERGLMRITDIVMSFPAPAAGLRLRCHHGARPC